MHDHRMDRHPVVQVGDPATELLQEDNTPKHTGPAALFECYTNHGTDILLLWQPPSFHFYKPVIPLAHTNGAYSILSIHKRLSVCRASRSPGSFPCQRTTCSCLLLPLPLRKTSVRREHVNLLCSAI